MDEFGFESDEFTYDVCYDVCEKNGLDWTLKKPSEGEIYTIVYFMEAEEEIDFVFCCTNCGTPVERDSREHEECVCDETGELWYCADCHNACDLSWMGY